MKQFGIMLVAAFLLLGGCRHKETNYGSALIMPVDTMDEAFICTPADGQYNGKTFRGTGAQTARALATALSPYVRRITFGEHSKDQNVIFETARKANARYVYVPSIVSWGYRRPMSWRRSKLTVDIKIFDLQQSEDKQLTLHKELYEEGWNNITSDSKPDALIQTMFEKFAKDMFTQGK